MSKCSKNVQKLKKKVIYLRIQEIKVVELLKLEKVVLINLPRRNNFFYIIKLNYLDK